MRNNNKFYEYLAGIIDGDGSLLLSKQGYGSLEITMDSRDERCLQYIKNQLKQGKIKPRSGSKSVRFRIHNKQGMIDLINKINGLIRYPQRLAQLEKLCLIYDIPFKSPKILTKQSSYFSGLMDSDGTVTMSFKKLKHSRIARPQLTISITSRNREDLEILVKEFNGNIYIDKSGKYISYKWSIQSKKNILNFVNYLKKHSLHTLKQQRILMIEEYYRFYEFHAFKPENTVLYQSFKKWEQKWNSYGLTRDANLL